MSSIEKSSFSPTWQINEAGAEDTADKEDAANTKKNKDKDKTEPGEYVRDVDGALYWVEKGLKTLVSEAPTSNEQITY